MRVLAFRKRLGEKKMKGELITVPAWGLKIIEE